MLAARFDEYGSADVLQVREVPTPTADPGRVLIDVSHAGVNFAEVMFRRGQFPVGVPHVPGLEAAGTVRALGEGVTGLRVGQPVAALTLDGGGNAEVVSARAELVVPLDGDLAGLDPVLAAAALCNVTTAYGILDGAARLRAGETVAIYAAAGGVGTAAAQLARSMGASLVLGAVGSPDKVDFAMRYGYDAVTTYADLPEVVGDNTDGGVDLLLDSVGGAAREAVTPMLAPFGRHVIFGDAAAADATYQSNDVWFSNTSRVGYNLGGLAGSRPAVLRAHLEEGLRAVAEGVVKLDVTELPLAEVRVAHQHLESRASTGKFVLRIR
ncbi:quinone oxidoreductase family protein [Krasilnikovia sp. M28-CT-15]|uniref:quinone oxidoreductase family protein n=1 Tax=Krasilnikovia sp. M28-CT-15 TaxID=3373540 RepID=UPI003875CB0E